MRILLADETNSNDDTSEFFIYGGLHFDIGLLPQIDAEVSEIRNRYNYRNGDALKWSTNGRSEHISPKNHREAKNEVLELAYEMGAEFIPVMVLHDLIEDEVAVEFERCLRDLLGQFQFALDSPRDGEHEFGIAVVDHIPEGDAGREKEILEDTFSHGLQFGGGDTRDLDRIKMMSATYSEASHASSLTDIVLGAFQFCLNNPNNPATETIFPKVARITKGFNVDEGFDFKYGVVMRPLDPGEYGSYSDDYGDRYEEAREALNSLFLETRPPHA